MSSEELRAIFDQLIKQHGVQGIYIAIRAMNDLAYDKWTSGCADPAWVVLQSRMSAFLDEAPEGYYVRRTHEGTFYRMPVVKAETEELCKTGVRDFSHLAPRYHCVRWGDFAASIRDYCPYERAISIAEAMEMVQREVDRLSES